MQSEDTCPEWLLPGGGDEAWRAADAAVSRLVTLFPLAGEAAVCASLAASRGDEAAACESLRALPPPLPPPPPPCDDPLSYPALPLRAAAPRAAGSAPPQLSAGRVPLFLRVASSSSSAAANGVSPDPSGLPRAARAALARPVPQPRGCVDGGPTPTVEWRDTGAGVSRLYSSLRAEAMDHLRSRNEAYRQAQAAFAAGDGAAARRVRQTRGTGPPRGFFSRRVRPSRAASLAGALGRRGARPGRAWRLRTRRRRTRFMRRATCRSHLIAQLNSRRSSTCTDYTCRCARRAAPQHNSAPLTRCVQEAVDALRRAVASARAAGATAVHVLVGTAHHSLAKHSAVALAPAVEAWLRGDGRATAVRSPTPGMLLATWAG